MSGYPHDGSYPSSGVGRSLGGSSYSFDSASVYHPSLASDSQQVTMDDINFLDELDADEASQHAREIAHLPKHLRPDHISQSQVSEYGAANMAGFHFHETGHGGPAGISSTTSEMSASQQTEASALVDDMLLADEFEGEAPTDLAPYDMKSLPPHACKYCGIHSPASVVKCAICNKW
jgi:hypothetical protein